MKKNINKIYPVYHHNIIQGTEEWINIRKMAMTASHAQAIAAQGAGLNTYIMKMMEEYYFNGERPNFTNEHIERGNELEPEARMLYAINNEVEVKEVGFIEYSEFVGCSPDALVGDDGLLEIKCPDNDKYFKHLVNGEKAIDSTYKMQMQMQLLVSGRKWCDYMAYNKNYEKSSFIHRFYPDKEIFKKLLIGFEIGEEKIKSIKKSIEKNLCKN